MPTAGIDAGSRTTKAVIVGDGGKVLARAVHDTGADVARTVAETHEAALEEAGLGAEGVGRVLATGYGRRLVSFADDVVTEITCHARGALQLFPDARTVLDIGGQDSKLIRIGSDGIVRDFAMNERCAAGTGRFIEIACSILGVTLQEAGRATRTVTSPATINSTCVVFAESEVISLVSQGTAREEVLAGVYRALAKQVLSLTGAYLIDEPVVFTGGVALNEGMVQPLREALQCEVRVPESPQSVGALGAALIAAESGWLPSARSTSAPGAPPAHRPKP